MICLKMISSLGYHLEERNAADCPKFAPLLNATAKTFSIREVSADADYLYIWQLRTCRVVWRDTVYRVQVQYHFGDHVRSRTDRAMANEALCKVLCHNVCCLIQSTYELGVEATFWGGDPFEPRALRSRPRQYRRGDARSGTHGRGVHGAGDDCRL